NLQGTRSKTAIHELVSKERDLATYQGQTNSFTNRPAILNNQRSIAVVIRVYADTRIAQHGFGPRRCDRDRAGAVRKRVSDVPKAARNVLVIDFEIGQRRFASR